ncbi:lipocalin-like domain-containing protein [Paeniroseomonas aquatica]|uniref:lipocalin-like domain-containing protein n=1 Tax=Paeniroseomonas aquatica TaxID=373043 RepID=UPI00360EE0EA
MLSMLGTWRLVAVRAFDPEGREVPSQYGHLPMGVVTFEPTRMMAVLGDSRPPAAGEARFYTSYTGPWTFDGATLVTRVDGCSDPARMGTDQIARCGRRASTSCWCRRRGCTRGDAAAGAGLGEARLRLATAPGCAIMRASGDGKPPATEESIHEGRGLSR